jgi:RNA polymerase sigma factor (sigma-70 family)
MQMATSQLKRVIHTLHRAAAPGDGAGSTDGQLLESYLISREESAFAALVHRHGQMVWGVCRRLLRCHHDAEDAFQATFLVLVRKASSVVPRDKVANWLYGVAHQTALYARATLARRSVREKQMTSMPEPVIEQQDSCDDLQALLDGELSRLPEKYRAVIVLCDLEGKTRKEAARHFHVPEGTVASRLATARAMLAKRLSRNGRAVSSAALTAMLAHSTSSASVPASVSSSTIKAASLFAAGQVMAVGAISGQAVAFAEGVLKTMLLTKLKIASVVLVLLAVLGVGAVALTQRVRADKSAGQPVGDKSLFAERPVDQPGKEKAEAIAQPVKAEKEFAGQQAKEQGEKNNHDPGAQVGGCEGAMVKAVDVERGTITFDDKAPAGVAGRTFALAADATVTIDGKAGKLTGLPAGAFINVTLSVNRQTICHINAQGPQISDCAGSMVKAVDVEKSTITFDEKARAEVAGKTFQVAADAGILIDGKPGKLSGLPAGSFVNLTLSVDRQTIRHLSAGGPQVSDCSGSLATSVDPVNRTITFDDKARAGVAGKTFRVAEDALITIDGKRGTLSEMPSGSFVNLTLAVDRATIRQLTASGPQVSDCTGSMVTAVDVEKSTITFDDKARAEVGGKTFRVADNAWLLIDGKSGKLSNLPAGSFVNLTFCVDRQTIHHLSASGAQLLCDCGGSKVKAVDVEKSTITFSDKTRAEVAGKTFTVAKDACILINGKLGKLSELPVGAAVSGTLCVDQKTVGKIDAKAL